MESKLYYEFVIRNDKMSAIKTSEIICFLAEKENNKISFNIKNGVETALVVWDFINEQDYLDNLETINKCLNTYFIDSKQNN